MLCQQDSYGSQKKYSSKLISKSLKSTQLLFFTEILEDLLLFFTLLDDLQEESVHMTTSQDLQVQVAESVLQSLLSANCKVELNAKTRMLSLLSTETPHILEQQQFTVNEWNILLILLVSHPHYAPYETLLASLTSLSPSECRKILHKAHQQGPKMLKRELKPVQRALGHVRMKLNYVCPQLKISLIRELGYSLTTSSN